MSPGSDVTRLIGQVRDGDRSALARLVPLVYDQLRRLAARGMRGERRGHTLQTTALVHEAWLRLADAPRLQWRDRAHFLAVAATEIRRVLVDHGRAHRAQKRGGGAVLVQLDEELCGSAVGLETIVDVDAALQALAANDARKARVVELRFFAGLEIEEVAEVLGVSHATVERDWAFARAWLLQRLHGEGGDAR